MPASEPKSFSLNRFFRSFGYAAKGFVHLIQREQNMLVHLVAAGVTILAAIFFPLTAIEWCLIILSIALVWAMEMVNTAVEALVDMVSRERHPLAGAAKDLAAGAVLIVAIAAALVGIIIFGKHILLMFPLNS